MVPATTLLLGGIFLDDTPNSLCERGHPEKVCMMSFSGRHPCNELRSCSMGSDPHNLASAGLS